MRVMVNLSIILIEGKEESRKARKEKRKKQKRKYNVEGKEGGIRIQQTWNMTCFIIPVIILATGIVTKGLKSYLETISGKHSTESLQKKQLY
jgi:hypothetical protein